MSISPGEIRTVLVRTREETRARCVLVTDGAGRPVASDGEAGSMNTQSLAERAVEQMSGSGTRERLVRERGENFYDEDEDLNVHVRAIGGRLILVAIYDGETSTGFVIRGARDVDAVLADRVRTDRRYSAIRGADHPNDDP